MTMAAADPVPVEGYAAGRAGDRTLSPLLLIGIASVLSFVLSWGHLDAVWQTGTFFDTDDAMRMVQVRNWLGGQSWFDLAVHRLDPPGGVFLHWSRVVDVPVAILIRTFALFAPEEAAERLARIVFPLALQTALIAATLFTARVLAGRAAALPAMLLIVTSCFQFGQFPAGRIDHHAPQITLLMLMAGLAVNIVKNGAARSAALLGLCAAVSVAISLENLPFIAVIVAAIGLAWVGAGGRLAAAVTAFGVSIAVATTVLFVALIAPSRYGVVTTDAFSLPHLLAAILGGLALSGLGSFGNGLSRPPARLMALGAAGVIVMAALVLACPGVLTSPYAGIDPVVRAVWLERVTEALPLPRALALHPQAITMMLCPILAGLAASLVACCRERGSARHAWMLVAALILTGLAGSCWEVRVVSSTTPLAVLGGVWVFATLRSGQREGERGWTRPAAACLALMPFSTIAWATVPTPDEKPSIAKSAADAEACRAADNVRPLARLGSGIVFAPIDSGSHLLVHTDLSVVGAPYHRNNHGNRTVIDGFSADGPAAEAIVRGTGARFVALCPGQVQAEALTSRNAHGLAARLLADDPPPWLTPVPVQGTTYKVFAVR